MKTYQMRKAKAIFSELTYSKGISHGQLWLRLKGRHRMGKLYSGEKGGFRCALIGSSWPGEAIGKLTRSGGHPV